MAYQHFAYVYDQLMSDAPYEKWRHFVKENIQMYKKDASTILDIGCGTGAIALLLARDGYHITGVDVSAEMLSVAYEKAMNEKLHLPLFEQDMRHLEALGLHDVAVIFCDSLNYLEHGEDVKKTFSAVHHHLNDGGLFLFDVHSTYKINEIFGNHLFGSNDDECSFLWQCFQGEEKDSVEHELTFFIQDPITGRYDRYDEYHKQRTFPVDLYKKWLKETGFKVIKITADFENREPNETAERIFFVAKKETIES